MKSRLSKNQRTLIRILAAGALFLAAFLIDRLLEPEWYLSLAAFLVVFCLIGYDVVWKAIRGIVHGQVLDENLLMLIAAVGAFCIGEYPEALAVILFYQVGELFQSYAVGKSRKSIASLMDIRPDAATVWKDGEEKTLDPDEVQVGDLIVVRPGERIPLDGTVVDGQSSLNTSALTGESVPVTCRPGDAVLSGSINMSGVLRIRCDKLFYDSTFSKILDLVENASTKKAKAENFISKFAKYYTPIVVALAVVLAIVPPLFTHEWTVWIRRALTFLVVSCPCALVISVPLSFFGGIGGASRQGILVKGGNYLELLSKVNTVVFDKTGTITKGSFEVQQVYPPEAREHILHCAAVAESGSLHPIALSVRRAAGEVSADGYEITEIAGKGVSAEREGQRILVGNAKLLEENGIECTLPDDFGTIVCVAENGAYLGAIVISDRVKEDSTAAVAELKAQGCKTVMLTGDNAASAQFVADLVGIDSVAAELLPADKVEKMESLLREKKPGDVVAFAGDGINDAPVLMRADVGIAMGGVGSDSAIEAADVVLMYDTLTSIPLAKRIARKTVRIVRENIVFALSVKIAVLILSAAGLVGMWLAIFADVGVSVLAVLNAMRMIFVSKAERMNQKLPVKEQA